MIKKIILILAFTTIQISGSLYAQCVQPLTKVGPQKATYNNQVFDHLQILTTTNVPAIDVGNFDGVKITNCWIDHYGKGIYGDGCNDLQIDHCVINCNSAPTAGPGIDLSSDNSTDNILVYSGTNVHITNVECHDGSHNIAVGNGNVNGFIIQNVNCYNPRGKASFGGNAIVVGQLSGVVNGTISDFYCYLNPTIGWSEDMFSIGSGITITIRRGCVDGNNSPTGDGIMIEGGASNIVVDSVDILNQGNGVAAVYSNAVAAYKNIRIRGEKTGSYNVGGNIRNVPNGVCLLACNGATGTLINCLIDKPTILNSCCGYITSCGMTTYTTAGPNWTAGSYAQITNGTFTARGAIALTCMPVKNMTTSTDFPESYSNSVVYPNPFSTNVTLQISSGIIIKEAVMKIYDVCGREVERFLINNNETVIDKGELQNGIYFYSIINNNESIGKGKLVIQ